MNLETTLIRFDNERKAASSRCTEESLPRRKTPTPKGRSLAVKRGAPGVGRAPTPFEERVYEAVRRVPVGTVTTYGAVARRVGCGSARAVGRALRRNPFAPDVPCHRVIRADLRVGGFYGRCDESAVARKKALLAGEGVVFSDGRLADLSRIYP